MSGRGGLKDLAPPPRRKAEGRVEKFTPPADGERVQFNTRIRSDRAIYVRILAAKTGRKPSDLVAEAIDLLEEKYGAA